MNPLDQITTVKGYALLTGLHIRKVQRMCEKGELTAKYVHGIWLILLPSKDYRDARQSNA